MSLRIRFRFDGRCSVHPRYNPERDGRPQHKDCPGCDSLWVVCLYTGIARRKAEAGDGIFVVHPEIHADRTESAAIDEEDRTGNAQEQTLSAESGDTGPLT
jgi:hypothetical protein